MIDNPSFETMLDGGHPGRAESWTAATIGALEVTAEFTGDLGLAFSGHESFEHGWSALNPQTLLTGDDAFDIGSRLGDSFETRWSPLNDQQTTILTALSAAVFATPVQTVETFEDGWKVFDATLLFALGPTAALAVESFSDWAPGASVLGATAAASFGAAGLGTSPASPSAVEQFELRVRQLVTIDADDDSVRSLVPFQLVTGDAVSFAVERGELPSPISATETYLVDLGGHLNKLTIRTTADASEVEITDYGSGVHYVIADPGRFWIDAL